MTRGWRWAILGASGVILGAVGYIAGGDSGGPLLALVGLIGGPLLLDRLLSIGQLVSDQVRDVESSSSLTPHRISEAEAEMIAAADPMTRELVPDLVEALPSKLDHGERLTDAAVSKSAGGPGLVAVTDRRVLFMPSAAPDEIQAFGYGELSSLSERASGELVAIAFVGPSGATMLEVEVSPPNASRIAMHVRGRIGTPPVAPGRAD
jgi:hypothetical protein